MEHNALKSKDKHLINASASSSSKCTWTAVQACLGPSPRKLFGACLCKNYVYLYGGRGGTKPLNDFWKYDIDKASWSKVKIINEKKKLPALEGHTLVENNGIIYMFGGEISLASFGKVPLWKFNPEANPFKLEKLSTFSVTMPTNRREHISVVYNNKMIIHGGYIDLKGPTKEMWSYDIGKNSWDLCQAAMNGKCPQPRYKHSGTVFRDKLFIIGGLVSVSDRNHTKVWTWDFLEHQWSSIRTSGAPGQLYNHTTCIAGTEMFVFGGNKGSSKLNKKLWKIFVAKYYWKDMLSWKSCKFKNSSTINPNFCFLIGLSQNIVQLPKHISGVSTKQEQANMWKPFLYQRSNSSDLILDPLTKTILDDDSFPKHSHDHLQKVSVLDVLSPAVGLLNPDDKNVNSELTSLTTKDSTYHLNMNFLNKKFSTPNSSDSLILENNSFNQQKMDTDFMEFNITGMSIKKPLLKTVSHEESAKPLLINHVKDISIDSVPKLDTAADQSSPDIDSSYNEVEVDLSTALLQDKQTFKDLAKDEISVNENDSSNISNYDSDKEALPILNIHNQKTKKMKEQKYKYNFTKRQIENNKKALCHLFQFKNGVPFKQLQNLSTFSSELNPLKPAAIEKFDKNNCAKTEETISGDSKSDEKQDCEAFEQSLLVNSNTLNKLDERISHVEIKDPAGKPLVQQAVLLAVGCSVKPKRTWSLNPVKPCIRVWRCDCT